VPPGRTGIVENGRDEVSPNPLGAHRWFLKSTDPYLAITSARDRSKAAFCSSGERNLTIGIGVFRFIFNFLPDISGEMQNLFSFRKEEEPVEIYDLWKNVFFRNLLLISLFLYLISHISWFVLLSALAIVSIKTIDQETLRNLKLNELFSLLYSSVLRHLTQSVKRKKKE
jgi:hypothetical protein